MEQRYFWNSEGAQQDAKYYPISQVSNITSHVQPPNYNTSYSYNVSPNVSNVPPDVNSGNSMYQFASTAYHSEANLPNNVTYQNGLNQMNPQYGNQYYDRMDSAYKEHTGENYANWYTKSENVYNNNAPNEWDSNNPSTSWTTYPSAPWFTYDRNVTTYDKERSQQTEMYESQGTRESKWKYDDSEIFKHAASRQRSRSPYDKQEKAYRSQYEDYKDRHHQHNREASKSRDSSCDNKHFERSSSSSSSKKHGSYTSRSEGSYVNNRSRKRSKSREPHSSRDTTPTNNSKRTKGPTEREILLEKYR